MWRDYWGFTPSERHSWGQGRQKERKENISDLIKAGFKDAARFLELGEIPMGIKSHGAQTRSERLIIATDRNTTALDRNTDALIANNVLLKDHKGDTIQPLPSRSPENITSWRNQARALEIEQRSQGNFYTANVLQALTVIIDELRGFK